MSTTADDIKNQKKKLLCHACGTVSFVRVNKLPAHIRDVTCIQCGATIPLLDRLNPTGTPVADGAALAGGLSADPGALSEWDNLYTNPRPQMEESDDESGWLMSFSDVMTQLLAFFILLTAMSTMDRHKFDQAMQAISQALGGRANPSLPERNNPTGDVPGNLLSHLRVKLKNEQTNIERLRSTLQGVITQQGLKDTVNLQMDAEGLVIIFQSGILFEEGSADIREAFKPSLHEIGLLLAPLHNPVVVEGHTDNQPISTRHYPSNWELSAQRAINVVKFYTEEQGLLNPARVQASAAAFYRPRYNVNSEDGPRNRRIEIHVKKDTTDVFERILHSR